MAGALIVDLDGFLLEALVFLGGAGQQEGVGHRGLALGDTRNDIATAEPVGFGKVGGRPLCRVVGVGVVKAGDVQPLAARLPLDLHQFHGGDLIAVVGGVGAGVAGAHRGFDQPALGLVSGPGGGTAQQGAAALVGPGLFTVGADCVVNRAGEAQVAHASSQNRSVRYFSAESGSTVTMRAWRPAELSSAAIFKLATTAAAAEMPTSRPSWRANCLAIA